MMEKFLERCREQHIPGEFLTVDETLLGFRGRCSFRMFLPSKSEKYGLKIWTCVDSQTKYLYNARVYLGKGDMASGEEIVDHLTNGLMNNGRIIKYVSSGTVRSNRQGVPKEFVKEDLEVKRTKYIFRGNETLMKMQVKQNKSVLVYSTHHHCASFNIPEIGRKTCANHSVMKRFCYDCKDSASPEHKKPKEIIQPANRITLISCHICSAKVCVQHQIAIISISQIVSLAVLQSSAIGGIIDEVQWPAPSKAIVQSPKQQPSFAKFSSPEPEQVKSSKRRAAP
uniref:PiggyBac transposable element-derived protein domain-containing protein n=1 Tax=Ditylenchus dipsaci TaxID=166011 RepID=A0A915DTE6_9BILA